MIYINLLPVREIKNRILVQRQIYSCIVIFLLMVISLILFSKYQSDRIRELEEQQRKIQDEKNQYTKIVNQIKSIDDEKILLETRIAVIKNLKKESSLTVHILDEIASLTPSNRMWLKSLDQSSSKLILSGMALDDQTIAKYMDDLERSHYISTISLANTTMDKYADKNFKSFSISCTVGLETVQLTNP